jgi:rhomboid family GlyGly-CTERM serine protease
MLAPRSLAWPLLCAAWALAAVCIWLLPSALPSSAWQEALHWQRSSALSQAWRLWTSAMAHLSGMHLLWNVLALLGLGLLGWQAGAGAREVWAAVWAWPLHVAALLLWPSVQWYAGLSGLNHALAAIVMLRLAQQGRHDLRAAGVAAVMALVLLGKTLQEAAWVQPVAASSSGSVSSQAGFAVVQAAHLTGLLTGLLLIALIYAARILRSKSLVE